MAINAEERLEFLGVRIVKGQAELLDECVRLSGQSRTDLVREALAMYLPNLFRELKGEATNEVG